MSAQLALRYEFDENDDFGWLEAGPSTAKVSGKIGFWVQWQDVKEWASELAAFPMQSDHISEVDWGYAESNGNAQQSVIRIMIRCGTTGVLHVSTELADHIDPQVRCRAIFNTDFPALQRFAEDLAAMMDRGSEEAVLEGTEVP